MDQIITFDKSLQDRLNEYEEVFSGLETVPYTKIQSLWSYYLELTLDPNGWQAIWKIPRIKCEELNIPFPTIVLVYVVEVYFDDLTAFVRVLAVQDEDLQLPEKQVVSLAQLWPTKQQDKSIGLNLNVTANVVDMVRFFYIHLMMAWDEEEDSSDWKSDHLISRLRLFYDLRNGKIPKSTSEHIHVLLNEAKRLAAKREKLSKQMDGDLETNHDDKNVETLIDINVRLIEIQNEINLYENEMFRKVILKRQQTEDVINHENKSIWVVTSPQSADNFMQLLNDIKQKFPNDALLTFAGNLMDKLDSANPNDTILIAPEKYLIKPEGALITNYKLHGMALNNVTPKIQSNAYGIMFDCIGELSTIENLIIDCSHSQLGFLVRKGKLELKNCKIFGYERSSTQNGFLVLNGAILSMISCDISGFSMGIVGNSGSTITIEDCRIEKSNICAIRIYDQTNFTINQTKIVDCLKSGIIFDTQKLDLEMSQMNTFEDLNKIANIRITNVEGSGNGANVRINQSTLKAKEDLFENPNSDPTINEDSDEEMNGTMVNVNGE